MAAAQQGSGNKQILTTNTSSKYVRVIGPTRLSLSDDIGGGSAQVECRDPQALTQAMGGVVFTTTVEKSINFDENAINFVRVTLSGSSGANLGVWFQPGDQVEL